MQFFSYLFSFFFLSYGDIQQFFSNLTIFLIFFYLNIQNWTNCTAPDVSIVILYREFRQTALYHLGRVFHSFSKVTHRSEKKTLIACFVAKQLTDFCFSFIINKFIKPTEMKWKKSVRKKLPGKIKMFYSQIVFLLHNLFISRCVCAFVMRNDEWMKAKYCGT